MTACPSRNKSATIAARSTKNDPCTAHGKHPDDPTWTRTGNGLWIETRNGKKGLIPNAKLDQFFLKYKDCSTPSERNALARSLAQ